MPAVSISEISDLLVRSGLPIKEMVTIPGRGAKFSGVPDVLNGRLQEALAAQFPRGLYTHQTQAIREIVDGHDVCLATQTASGKSLVFMTAAVELILRQRSSRVLAVYPSKALIQDQLSKWNAFLAPFLIQAGFIDGTVPVSLRASILSSCPVIAITPDVVQAWLMSQQGTPEVAQFLQNLRLVILDETHAYDGAFGTNMAYLLRRLAWASGKYRIVCSTATIGMPERFMEQLTGRSMVVLDASHDAGGTAEKTLLLVEPPGKRGFDATVQFLSRLAKYGKARFLAFGDSRKAVERIVGAILRQEAGAQAARPEPEIDEFSEEDGLKNWPRLEHVLPYRAGYEATDRQAIQRALTEGSLAGVVSTSALELGLDIGDLDIVVLLNTPPTVKSFRQRIGRAGRKHDAVCVLIDDRGLMAPLSQYLERRPEPSWLYLDNRYIQYSHALCAAIELQARGAKSTAELHLGGLPETFRGLVENELNPTSPVDQDLYGLKQRAQGSPHYEFPIRSAAEPNFEVEGPMGLKLGILSYGQALREAYPGAVYYYMARPYRIQSLGYKNGLIKASFARHITTKPVTDTMAFPDFKNGVIASWKSDDGFLAEVELQVNERVRGFVEQRGQNVLPPHDYGPGSPYSQKPLLRPFMTTGVCWAFPSKLDRSEAVGEVLLSTFAATCGIHERDLGVALFHANEGPFAHEQVKGTVVFDAINGSLRLTEHLARRFSEIVRLSLDLADLDLAVRRDLQILLLLTASLEQASTPSGSQALASEGGWVRVIDRGQPAMYLSGDAPAEVTVLDFRYTPNGLMYQLEPIRQPGYFTNVDRGAIASETTITRNSAGKWMVIASSVQALGGKTRMVRYNVVTGDEMPDA